MELKDKVLKDLEEGFGFDPRNESFSHRQKQKFQEIAEYIRKEYPEFKPSAISLYANQESFFKTDFVIPFSIDYCNDSEDSLCDILNLNCEGDLFFLCLTTTQFLFRNSKLNNCIIPSSRISECDFRDTLFSLLEFSSVESEGNFSFKISKERVAEFENQKQISKINFDHSCFKGNVIFDVYYDQEITQDKRNISFEISLNYAIFERPATFNLPFTKCPDFSKAHFLSSVIIEDTWPKINEVEITAADEGKFRFLKNYFAKANNHLKEQEYFRYEMLAKAKALKGELRKELGVSAKNIPEKNVDCRVASAPRNDETKDGGELTNLAFSQSSTSSLLGVQSQSSTSSLQEAQSLTPSLRAQRGNPCLLSKLKFECIKFITRVKNFIKINFNKNPKPREIFWQRRLIKIYERFSKFGSSISRPIAAQVIIFIEFALIYHWFFCVDSAQSFWASLIKTLVPITNMKDLLPIDKSWQLSATTTFHGLLSAIFLFLLLLAIRNRFKIK